MKNKKGFTLVELLAVIAVIGVLISMAAVSTVKIMNNGKKKTEKLSAKDYVTAVNDYNVIAEKTNRISTSNCNCSAISATVIRCKVEGSNGVSTLIKDSISGRLPKSGTVDINTTTYKVVSAKIKVKNYTINYSNGKY